MTVLKQISSNMASKEILINELNAAMSSSAIFMEKNSESSGVNYYYYGGYYPKNNQLTLIQDGHVTCAINTTNYIYYDGIAGEVKVKQTNFVDGDLPILVAITDSEKIISKDFFKTFKHFVIGENSGGDSNKYSEFGELIITNNSISSFAFKVAGGIFYNSVDSVSLTNSITVSDFSDTRFLSPDSTFYIIYDKYSNNISMTENTSVLSNNRILYIIKTDATKISLIQDFRKDNLSMKSNTFITTAAINGVTTVSITDISETYLKQKVNTLVTSSEKPRLMMFSANLICTDSELNYDVGDEAEYVVFNNNTTGRPYKYNDSSITFYTDNLRVFNFTSGQYDVIDKSKWLLVVKYLPNFR